LQAYGDDIPLKFTNFFSGFQRDDGRSWLGFHDELSNLKDSRERLGVIAINRKWNRLTPDDLWTENGTYLAYLRISIDLYLWERIERKKQDLIVGRDKISGRPILGVDKKGNPVINRRCPLIGEFKGYNQDFHDHPNYLLHPTSKLNHTADLEASISTLNRSHIGRTRHIGQIDSRDPSSNRIFRQGFEFIEPAMDRTRPMRLGLNFVSFQNDPHRIFSLLTSPHWLGGSSFGGDHLQKGISDLFSVNAAGVFFVPPPAEPFPGANILA
jgi:deferrochelatase/peroxidase EfeB